MATVQRRDLGAEIESLYRRITAERERERERKRKKERKKKAVGERSILSFKKCTYCLATLVVTAS